MKKILLFLLFTTLSNSICFSAPPSRIYNYTSGTTIRGSDVSGNEDAIFNYLQTGVDSFLDGSIVNADISSGAAISYSKLSLGSSITSNDITDGSIVNADINSSAGIVGSKLDLTSPGAIGGTSPSSGKFTTLEATSTFKVGTTNQGDVLYDNGTSIVRLPPGTSGRFLKTQGTSANPIWADIPTQSQYFSLISVTTMSTASSSSNISISSGKNYKVVMHLTNQTASAPIPINITFNGDTAGNDYNWINSKMSFAATPTETHTGSTTANLIQLFSGVIASGSNVGEYYLSTEATNFNASIIGSGISNENGRIDASGLYTGGAVTFFNITTGDNCSGKIYLYEMVQS